MRGAKREISFPVNVESMKSCSVSTPQFDWDASQTGDNSIINRDSCRYGLSVSGHSRLRPLGLGPNQNHRNRSQPYQCLVLQQVVPEVHNSTSPLSQVCCLPLNIRPVDTRITHKHPLLGLYFSGQDKIPLTDPNMSLSEQRYHIKPLRLWKLSL